MCCVKCQENKKRIGENKTYNQNLIIMEIINGERRDGKRNPLQLK